MFLLNWYREYLEIKYEKAAKKRELEFCEACETLKLQLSLANDERKRLIDRLVDKPEAEPIKELDEQPRAIMPSRVQWGVRRQSLEAESRANAAALRRREEENKKDNSSRNLTINEIEKELGVTKDA